MDLPLHRKCLEFSRRNKKRLFLIAVLGASGYGAYKAYNLPYVAQKRKRLTKLLRAFASLAELLSNSAETLSLVSNDLNQFITSDSDEIPNSLKQLSKIATSDEFSTSLVRVSQSITQGILLGYSNNEKSQLRTGNSSEIGVEGSSFSDKVLESLFSKAGTGFMSVVVGSFARNLVLGFYSNAESVNSGSQSEVPTWVNAICDERCGKLIGDCVQIFVSTAVAVFLDKTMDVNTYDEMFAGMTNPKHHEKVKGVLVSMCNGAVETLVKTSHQVLTNPNVKSNSSSPLSYVVGEGDGQILREGYLQKLRIGSSVSSVGKVGDSGWLEQIKSTLSVPANQKFVLDVTGRVTFETVRSFVEFFLLRIFDGFKWSVNKVHDEVIDKGMQVVGYVGAKSSVFFTLCLALYLHILGGSYTLTYDAIGI